MFEASPFHEIGSMFPDEVTLETVTPDTPVHEALKIMQRTRYSQLPVVDEGELSGVFSLWSLTSHLALWPGTAIGDLTVQDVTERIPTVTVKDPLDTVLEALNLHDAVLVTSPRGLQAVATATDVLNYFYAVARPFVLLQEIELGLRDVISRAVSSERLPALLDTALGGHYQATKRPLPSRLEELTFEEYRNLVVNKSNWEGTFGAVFGGNRQVTSTRLDTIREIRNRVFHFRDESTIADYQALAVTRDWVLRLASRANPRLRDGMS